MLSGLFGSGFFVYGWYNYFLLLQGNDYLEKIKQNKYNYTSCAPVAQMDRATDF